MGQHACTKEIMLIYIKKYAQNVSYASPKAKTKNFFNATNRPKTIFLNQPIQINEQNGISTATLHEVTNF